MSLFKEFLCFSAAGFTLVACGRASTTERVPHPQEEATSQPADVQAVAETEWVASFERPVVEVATPVTVEEIATLPPATELKLRPAQDPKPVEIPVRYSLCNGKADSFAIDTKRTSFDARNALSSMWLSKVIQLPEDDAIESLSQVPQNRMRIVRFGGSLQAVVIDTDASVIVTLRGTQEVMDYLHNSMFVVRSGEKLGFPGKIHAGFYVNFSQLWQAIENAVFEFDGARKGVWITGHSLGGAVGSLAAYRFNAMKVPVHGVYKFGSPVTGDVEFAEAYTRTLGDRTFLLAHGADITPHVPPPPHAARLFASLVPGFAEGLALKLATDLNYAHVGAYFQMTSRESLTRFENPTQADQAYWSEMRSTAGSARLPFLFLKHAKYIADHDATAYYCNLRQAVGL